VNSGISLAISHTPWIPQAEGVAASSARPARPPARSRSFRTLAELGVVVPNVELALQTGDRHCLFLQDDVQIAPDFGRSCAR